jgi:hypothetical protein
MVGVPNAARNDPIHGVEPDPINRVTTSTSLQPTPFYSIQREVSEQIAKLLRLELLVLVIGHQRHR